MKNLTSKSLRFIPVILGLMFCLLANSAGAAVLYWDNNGTAAATSGTWNTTSSQWATSSVLTASPGVWVTSDAACFTAGAGNTGTINITVNSAITMEGIFNGALNPSGCYLNLINGGSGSLNIPSGVQAALDTGGSDSQPTIVGVPFTGPGMLFVEGSKPLSLNVASSHTGGTTLNGAGTVSINNNNSFGANANPIYPYENQYAGVAATVPVTIPNPITAAFCNYGINFASSASCPVTLTGNVDLQGNLFLRNAGGSASLLTLSGIISDVGGLNLSANASSVTLLRGANTFGGGTTVSSAGSTGLLLQLGNASALGYGPTTVASGSVLDLDGTTGVNSALTLNGTGLSSGGALINSSATPVTLNSGSGVAAITLTGNGSGISAASPPTITITGTGTGATASPVLGVTPASFTVSAGTLKYTVAPTVTIYTAAAASSGGAPQGGISGYQNTGGATATCALAGAAPSVISTTITVTSPGLGFGTLTPTIVFSGGTTSGAGTAPSGTGNTTHYQLSGVQITAPGSGYTSAPSVSFSSGGATATASLPVVNLAAASSIGGAGNLTINGVITGAAANSLTKVGAGTVTLTGPNTYSGATTVSQGELIGVVGGSIANSALTLNSGTELGVSITDDTKQFSTGALTLSAGTTALDFNFGPFTVPSTTIAPLNVNGAAAFNGTATVSVEAGSLPAGTGTYPLMAWTSQSGTAPTSVTLPPLVSGNLGISGSTLNLNITGNTQPLTWNSTGTGTWDLSDSLNLVWDDSTATPAYYVDGVAVVFDQTYITGPTVVTLNSSVAPASVTVNNSTYPYTISGTGHITGSAGLSVQGTGTMTLLNANTYTGGTMISAGTLQLGDGATANGSVAGNISVTSPGNLVFANPNPQTFAGAITGTGLVTVQGPALLTLGDGVANNGTVAGSILDNASLAFANPFAETYSGVLSGLGTLSASGPGALTLTGVNSYGGPITISAGNLTIGGAGQLGSGSYAANIADNATFTYNSSAAQTLSGVISGTGALVQNGPGTLTLSGANSYSGVSTLKAGTVQVASTETAGTSGPLGKSAAANPGSIVLSGGTLQFSGANANDYSGRFSTAASQAYNIDVNGQPVTFGTALTSSGGALTLSDTAGGGTLSLSALNTYTGNTTINAGSTLNISGSGYLGAGIYAGTIANNGTLSYTSSATQTNTGSINGSGTLIVNNSALNLWLSGALANTTVDITSGTLIANKANPNVFAPGTIITFGGVGTSGTLDLYGRATINISQIAVAAGATASSQMIQNGGSGNASLQINGTCSFGGNIVAGPGTGSTALTVSGSGITLTLSGNNTYAGTTTIASGAALTLSGSGTLPSAPAMANSGTFNYNSSASQTISGVVSGAGALNINNAAGTLNLTDSANTFTGPITITAGTLTISGSGKWTTPYAGAIADNGTFNFNSAAAQTFSGNITGSGALGFNPAGANGNIVTLSGNNASFTGPASIANLGQVVITADSQLGTPAAFSPTQLTMSGGFLRVSGTTALNVNRGITLGTPFSIFGQSLGGSIQVDASHTLTIAGPIADSVNGGVMMFGLGENIPTQGLGTNLLTAANTYIGPTVIANGRVELGAGGSLPYGTTLVMVPDNSGGSFFDLGGFSQTIGPLSTTNYIYTGTGTGSGTPTIVLSGASALTILQTNTTTTFNGLITGSGSLAFNGNSLGTNILAKANNYTGGTTISGGTLDGSVAGSIPGNVTNTDAGILELDTPTTMSSTAILALDSSPAPSSVNLNYTGTQTIVALYFGGTAQAQGVWGAVGNPGATYTSTAFTGTGLLNVCPAPDQTITGAASAVCANSAGNTASVTSTPGATYAWAITGGTITGGGSSSTVTYTAGASGAVTLNCVVTAACGTPSAGGQNISVTINPLPTVSVNSAAVCAGTPAMLTATTSASSPSFLWNDPASSTTASITVSPASTTTYTVIVTDGVTGCANSGSGTVTVNPTPIASAGLDQSLSCLGCGVTIGGSPTASGGSGVYSYSWSPATGLSSATVANPTASPLSTTTYTVTVTDADGCISAPSSMTVTVATAAPTISAQPANTAVCSGSTTSFSVTASGSGLSYYWTENNNSGWGNAWTVTGSGSTWLGTSTDNDQGNPDCNSFSANGDINSPISGNALGMYGGTAGDEVAVRSFPALTVGQTVSIDFDNGNVDFGSKVGFSLQDSSGNDLLQFYFVGGQANYKYWDTALGEQDSGIAWGYTGNRVQFALTCGNAYVLIVTPCGGTPTTLTGTYSGTIAQVKLFNGNTLGGDEDNIYFNNFIIGGYTDNADNYSSGWAAQDQGNQPIASANASTYTTPALSATAQYQAVVAGCSGVVLSSVATVTVNPLPTVSVNSPAICTGGSAVLTATTSASSPSYLWDDPASSTTASITVSPASTTTYTVTVTDGLTGCANTGSGTVTVNPLPTVSVDSATICAGGSANLTATTSASSPSYLWNDPAASTTVSIMVSPASTTTYTVTVTDGVTGCANTGSGTVTVNPLPAVSVNSAVICPGGSAVLTATTDASSPTYQWNDPASSTTASITVSPASTTTYTVTVTDGVTGCANLGSGTVTVNPLPMVSVNSTAVCPGGSATLTATTSASSPSYLWSPGGAATASITVSPASTTTYTVTVTDGVTGCANGGSGTVTVNTAPTADAGDDQTVCAGSAVEIGGSPTGSGGSAPYSYSWSPTTGLSDATAANPTASVGSTTTYTVTVTDHNGCTATDSIVLTVPPLPNIESVTMSGTDVTLVWDSLAGQVYRVQYTTDLPDPPTPATWTDLTPDVTAAGATATVTDHAGAATQRFYRIFIVCP